jgi:hypothetical protein
MKKICALIIVAASTINCYSNDAFSFKDEFKKRKLIIALQEENPKTIEKLTKKNLIKEIDSYKANVKLDNEITQKVFTDLWKETPIEFIPESKIISLSDEELSKSSLMMHEAASDEGIEFMYYNIAIMNTFTDKKGNKSSDKHDKFFKVSLENDVVSFADLLFLLQKMRVLLDYQKQFDQTGLDAKLASKTLLIDKDAELSQEEAKDNYDFPFKLVTKQEILDSKNSMDKKTLYTKVDVYAGVQNFLIVESETGNIIARSTIAGVTKVSFNAPSERHQAQGQLAMAEASGANQNKFVYRGCSTCGSATGQEIFRLYTAKAKLQKAVLRLLNNQKRQIKYGYLVLRAL